MRANELCKDCCRRKAAGLLKEQAVSEEIQVQAMEEITEIMYNTAAEESAPFLMSKAMKVVEKYTEIEDAYEEPKRQFNQLLLTMEDDIIEKIEQSDDKLLAGLQYALTGNFIDFGAMDSVDETKLTELLAECETHELDAKEYQRLQVDLETAKKLVYITDNAGEVVLDKVCIRTIQKLYPELEIKVIVRGAPALNDATMEDAKDIGLTEIVQVIPNGTAIPGTPIHHISEEARSAIEAADLCIAKGQGNFETMWGCGLNIYYLFLCKCKLFVEKFGVEQFSGILKNEREKGDDTNEI